jgi:hypothetical protein
MDKKQPKERSIADLMKAVPSRLEQIDLFIRMGEIPDHIMVLLSVALLDRALADAIAQHFKAGLPPEDIDLVFDDSKAGPLSTLAAKGRVAFAIGIFGERTRRDLRRIRNIRNAFAHAIAKVDFNTPEIKKACEALEAGSGTGRDAREKFLVSFWVYFGALSGYHLNDRSIVGEKYRTDLS